VENKLFATLDSFTRRVYMPEFGTILMTDTVGFIQSLPLDLVASFRSTLEEICDNDILLHVVDAANPWREQHQACVRDYILELGVADKPVLTFYNKCDIAEPAMPVPAGDGICSGSVHTGEGILELKQALAAMAIRLFPSCRTIDMMYFRKA
jgi:GTP-binding protein HflX